MENVMEAELASGKRKRLEAGETIETDYFTQMDADVVPSKKLQILPKAGKTLWWREEGWERRQEEGGDRGEQTAEEPLPTL